MFIQEEFLKRYGCDTPVLNYFTNANLLLVYKDKKISYTLMKIEFEIVPRQTGTFKINYLKAGHNSYVRSPILQTSPNKYFDTNEVKLEWDQYYPYLCDLFKGFKSTNTHPIINLNEINSAIWKMFIYSYDSWFVNQKNQHLINLLDKLLYHSSEDLLEYMKTEYSSVYYSFVNDFYKFVLSNYCYDLGKFAQYAIDTKLGF